MANFSGAVKLADLDDFLGPSQECIKPKMDAAAARLPGGTEKAEEEPPGEGRRVVQLEMEANNDAAVAVPGAEFGQIRVSADESKTATITLDDCLACSGCVTSAETVLITQQSTDEFAASLALPREGDGELRRAVFVVTVSPQSRAALAQRYGMGLAETALRLDAFFRSLGVDHVFDAACGSDLAQLEARAELMARVRAAAGTGKGPAPLLASECPGWVCYAEKTQGERVLDHISRVKSPQQAMGAVVKRYFVPRRYPGRGPADVYHATVMPCYDKKLEGSRADFFIEEHGTREVDCVLTTGEVLGMIEARAGAGGLAAVAPSPRLDSFLGDGAAAADAAAAAAAVCMPPDAGASGGYVESLYRHAARELLGEAAAPPAGQPLPYEQGRNGDFQELTLRLPGGAPPVRFARAYGFRNIQNVVRKLKRGRLPYAYVEVMACPSGCLNGGGQVSQGKGKDMAEQRRLLAELDGVYHTAEQRDPADSPVARELYREWLGGAPGSPEAVRLLHTQYHEIPKADANPLAIRW